MLLRVCGETTWLNYFTKVLWQPPPSTLTISVKNGGDSQLYKESPLHLLSSTAKGHKVIQNTGGGNGNLKVL